MGQVDRPGDFQGALQGQPGDPEAGAEGREQRASVRGVEECPDRCAGGEGREPGLTQESDFWLMW